MDKKYLKTLELLLMIMFICFSRECWADKDSKVVKLALNQKWDQVSKTLELNVSNTNPLVLLIHAYASLSTGDYHSATNKFYDLGKSIDAEKLIDYTTKLAKEYPARAIAQMLRGDALSRNGNYTEAIQCLDKAIDIDKNLALAYDVRGTVYTLSGNIKNAEDDFKKVISLEKNYANAYFNLGNVYLIKKELKLAEEYFNKALILEPNFGLAFNGRGLASLYQNDFEMAIYDFKCADDILGEFVDYKNLELIENLKGRDVFDTYFKELKIDERGGYTQTSLNAKPGDLIVRHGKGILGPPLTGGIFDDIPHIGMIADNNQIYHLKIENVNGVNHGIMHIDDLRNTASFKNPGFFSVLDSDIPIKHNGKLLTFKDLPINIKESIRHELSDLANKTVANKIYRDKGAYSAVNHCGDAIMDLYDNVLKSQKITVQRYKGISAFTNDERGLVDGQLRDWFVSDWLTAGNVMDPSEINDKLPRRSIPYTTNNLDNYQIKPNYWVHEDNNLNVAKNLVSMVERGAVFDNIPKNVVVCGKGSNADVMIKDFKDNGWKVTHVPEYNNFSDLQTIAHNNDAIITGVKNYKGSSNLLKKFEVQSPEISFDDFKKYNFTLPSDPPPPPFGGVLMKVKIVRKEKANVNEMFGIKETNDDIIDIDFCCPFLIYCGR